MRAIYPYYTDNILCFYIINNIFIKNNLSKYLIKLLIKNIK